MTNDDIERAIEAERTRCLELLEIYRPNFDQSTDRFMGSVWCRIYNQINMGVPSDGAAFGPHSIFEDDDDDQDDDEFDADDDTPA